MSMMPSGGYADYDLENQQLERRRKMAEMLSMNAQKPYAAGSMVGNVYVPTHWTQHAAQALNGYTADRDMERLDARQMDIGRRKQEDMKAQGAKFAELLYGKPATEQTHTADDQLAYGGAPSDSVDTQVKTPAVAGDMRGAVQFAQTSNNPFVQQGGAALMAKMLKQDEPYNLREGEVRMGPNGQVIAKNDKPKAMQVGPGGQVYDPYNVAPGTVLADPNKPFSVGVNGAPAPNKPYQDYEMGKAKAGASNVTVKTDVKTGESLAGQVGGIMKDSTSSAAGAVQAVDATQRIVNAVDTNKLFSGPGATIRLKGAQIAQAMNIGGKDDAEKIANTRSAIRGFAELTLQGRKQMTGQGAITESEGLLAEKANSGNIDDLTGPEIKQLAKASERVARFNYAQHERKMDAMRKNPSLQGVVPFYEAPAMPAEAASNAPVKRYNPATGGFE